MNPTIINNERCIRQGDIPEVMKLYEFIQELDEKYHVDSRDTKNSFGIIQSDRMLVSELYESNLYFSLFGYSSHKEHLPKYELVPLVQESIILGRRGEVGMLSNPYREEQKKHEINVDEADKEKLICLREDAYQTLKSAYPKKPVFKDTDKDYDKVLEEQGFASGDRKYEFRYNFRIEKYQRDEFVVEYYRLGKNKTPHFATSYKGFQNQEELPHDSLAYQFYKKWNPFHLQCMTEEEYLEMRNDLNELCHEYSWH